MEFNSMHSLPVDTLRSESEAGYLSMLCQRDPSMRGADNAEKLKRVSEQFEAVFVRQILKEMRDSVLKSTLFGDGMAGQTFQEMYDDHLAESITKAGGLGLGKVLYESLVPHSRRMTAQQVREAYEANNTEKTHNANRVEGEL